MLGYLALGSNLSSRRGHLRRGLADLQASGVEIRSAASIWETEPVGTVELVWFLNMVVAIRTSLPPLELLDVLQGVERRTGRLFSGGNAPRTLDVDLLMLGDLRWKDERLELPHPRLWQRSFVLEPLAEIAPRLRNPDTGLTVVDHRDRVRRTSAVYRRGRLPLAGIIRPSAGVRRSVSRHEIQIDRR
jgi:2-amino-4-hydroxy-6-hydroxymethyldihydropteridine diphosphokinase